MKGRRIQTRYPGRIIVTEDRVRRDLGDIAGLAKSIRRDGLLHPIVVSPRGELICGRRRLEAWRLLDRWDSPIPVHVVDIDLVARGEFAENMIRKELTPSEAVELMLRLRPAAAEAARERQVLLGRHHGELPPGVTPSVQLSGCEHFKGESRNAVALFTGRSARTLAKAHEVVKAAKEDPVRCGRLQDDMDRSGKVDAPYRRLQVIRQVDLIRAEPPPLPSRGPYRVIVVDPPWPFDEGADDQSERSVTGYPLMTLDQIRALPIPALAHEDCALWLWATNHHLLRYVPELLKAWGFEHKVILTWTKDKHGRGKYLLGKTEHCVLAVRGRPTVVSGQATTLLEAPRLGHSQKPAAFYDVVERVTPAARYCELFPHKQPPRLNWDRNYIGQPTEAPIEPASPYRVPSGPPIETLVGPGAIVHTNYGTGPFEVVGVSAHRLPSEPDVRYWSLSLVPAGTPKPAKGRKRTPTRWINDVVAVDGRILNLDRTNPDEVLIGMPERLEAAS